MPSFVKRWLKSPPQVLDKPWVPDGQRVYCIGDIHGRKDLLEKLIANIQTDSVGFAGTKSLVFLGDYIDRGEQSKEVIDFILNTPVAGFETVCLMGNHEQTLLDFLSHPEAVGSWLSYGGRATLSSYGVRVPPGISLPDLESLRDELAFLLPQEHLEFLKKLVLLHRVGNYCFVHAGIRPGVLLEEQRTEDLLWIRDEFTKSTLNHGYIIVHGHTISEEVEWNDNRIGIDTGAFQTGVLTCLVLEGSKQRLLQTSRDH